VTTAAVVSLRLARVAGAAAVAEAAGRQWLSDAERARLEAITAPGRRAQFVAGRWTLRQLLAGEMGGDALRDWPLTAGIDGPPRLQAACPADVHLAISHSGDWLACALATVPIGLDIEVPKPRRHLDGLVAAVFTASEQAAVAAAEPSARADLFHTIWTLKEAWLKRHAEGVSPGRLAQVHTRPATPAEANARVWSGGGLTLALVAPGDVELKCSGEAPQWASPQWWQVGG
jgi:4'-phosphopantetheinyl transferase